MSEYVLCCVCLVKTDDSVIGLFDKCARTETFLWKILFDVIGVPPDTYRLKDDMITSASKICRPCSGRLTESYEFRKSCQRNWEKLMLMTNEFISREEQEPPDVFKFKCNHCESSFRFECNLKIHIGVNHSNGRSNDITNEPIKSESETISQQIEVWIEEQRDEIGENKIPELDVTNPIEEIEGNNDVAKTKETKLKRGVERPSKVVSNRGRLKLKNSVERKDIKCLDCGETFTSSKFLKSHIQNVHSHVPTVTRKRREKRSEPRLCPICGKSFNAKNENGYQKHMFHHDPSIGKIKFYQCELCDRKFLGKRSLEEHINFHLNIRKYQCEVETCKKSFIYEQSYKNHKKLHLGKDFECSLCGKQFITSTNLKYHLTRAHQGVKKYACDQCDKSYFTLQHLKVHQLSHLEKKAYTCDVCNRGITHYASLLSHMLLHTGKPFQCDHCNMAFTHRWRFGKHLADRHSIFEIPKKYARKMAEKLVAKDDGGQVVQTVDTTTADP
ncbi:hypothetical protein HA402_002587 [Bradysia odoriphaga]|nr:hypothetical protein HA402_002587 [Bradysia odoriphaga]